jgi:hypothetical protein
MWLNVNGNSILGLFYFMDVGDVAKVSEACVAPIFREDLRLCLHRLRRFENNLFLNPILVSICTSTFSKLCKSYAYGGM